MINSTAPTMVVVHPVDCVSRPKCRLNGHHDFRAPIIRRPPMQFAATDLLLPPFKAALPKLVDATAHQIAPNIIVILRHYNVAAATPFP